MNPISQSPLPPPPALPLAPSSSSPHTLSGAAATAYISSLPDRIFGAESNGVELCVAEGGWEEGWRERFDADAGGTGAAVRRYMEGRTIKECERDWKVSCRGEWLKAGGFLMKASLL